MNQAGADNNLTTMVHEGGHAWMYPHVTGEGCLTWTALISGGTHAAQEDSCVAFNEGFAEFYASKAISEMVADGELSTTAGSVAPWNRAKLALKFSADTLGKVAKSDKAWEDVFRVLTTPDIAADAFGKSGVSPGLVGDSGGHGLLRSAEEPGTTSPTRCTSSAPTWTSPASAWPRSSAAPTTA